MLNHKLSNLMSDIRSCVTDVAIHFAHDTDVLVTVQQRVFLLALTARSVATEAGLVGLETGVREDDDQSLGVFVGGWYWDMLFGDELWECWGRERLSSCHHDED
jgi:hypothetical protein